MPAGIKTAHTGGCYVPVVSLSLCEVFLKSMHMSLSERPLLLLKQERVFLHTVDFIGTTAY